MINTMNNPAPMDSLDPIGHPHVLAKKKVKAKPQTPLVYRLMILYRFVLALVGGYVLSALSAIAIAEVFIQQRASAAMSATLIAFCVYCGAFIWVFMVQKTLKASLGIMVPSLVLLLLIKWLGN